MAAALLLLTAACLRTVQSQDIVPGGSVSSQNVQLCNHSFADVNGTGIFSYNPDLHQTAGAGAYDESSGTTLPIGIAATLIEGRNSTNPTQYSYWFSTNGANYTDDLHLGFDACGLVAGPFSEEVTARGARDDGSCETMFDAACVSALENDIAAYARALTFPPPPGITYNESSLPGVCAALSQKINSRIPTECTKYFTNGASSDPPTFAAALALTGPHKFYNESCTMNDTYFHIATLTAANNSQPAYDQLANTVVPILVVYMPVANAQITTIATQSRAGIICGHITHFNQGSRVVPLPAEPDDGKTGLSAGATAGAVVGAISGVALIAALAWMFFKKTRNARERARSSQGAVLVEADGWSTQIVQAPGGASPEAEMSASDRPMHRTHASERQTHELDAHRTHELPDYGYDAHELSARPTTPMEERRKS